MRNKSVTFPSIITNAASYWHDVIYENTIFHNSITKSIMVWSFHGGALGSNSSNSTISSKSGGLFKSNNELSKDKLA